MASKRLTTGNITFCQWKDKRKRKSKQSAVEVLVYLESGVMLIRDFREYCR